MKGTELFKETIKAYLDKRAFEDELFAIAYANEIKKIDDCVTYILNEVKKSGLNGFADEEIYSMAVHYYDEENIEIGEKINCRVVVNHTVELTEEEKAEARKNALLQYQTEEIRKMREKNKVKPKQTEASLPSLFD